VRSDLTRPLAAPLSRRSALPTAGLRALGAAGVLGGLLLLAAFVIEIRPDLNWLRLVLFNVGAIAVGLALVLRASDPGGAVLLTATAVIVTNAAHLGMTVLSLRIERPFAGDFGLVFFFITAAMWLSDAAFGAMSASRRTVTSGLGGRVGAVALAVGSVLAILGMDRIGLVSPERDSVFKVLALIGIFLNGAAWIVLGLDVAIGRRGGTDQDAAKA
jgi:hypothetical protein